MANNAQKTPKPMTRWYGRTRCFIGAKPTRRLICASKWSGSLLWAELRAARLAEGLLVQFADALRQRGQKLVGQRRHLVEHPRELAGAEHEHGDRRLGGDRCPARAP